MFILYGLGVGLVAGLLLGGRLERLASTRFRLWWLALVALGFQVALFSPLADPLPEVAARFAYVGSTAFVGVVVAANLTIPGVPLIALGAALNLVAVVANGGVMPASEAALATAGITIGEHTNSVVTTNPALAPLTDVFALPAWLPLANVFSVGDVLIGLGLAIAVAAGMARQSAPS